jgi:hypothetical protein
MFTPHIHTELAEDHGVKQSDPPKRVRCITSSLVQEPQESILVSLSHGAAMRAEGRREAKLWTLIFEQRSVD